MDALGLQTLASELEADVVVVVAAINLAGRRFAEATPSGHDSAAHHLSRAYNVIEQMALRVERLQLAGKPGIKAHPGEFARAREGRGPGAFGLDYLPL